MVLRQSGKLLRKSSGGERARFLEEESEPRNKLIFLAGENKRADIAACLTVSLSRFWKCCRRPRTYPFQLSGRFGNLFSYYRGYAMCLGIPAKVVQIDDSQVGKVDYLGTKIKTNFSLLDDVHKGDWVIVHAGFAISKLNEKEAQDTFKYLREYTKLGEISD
jgi:hydrogenase expression/formation protein HypC